MYLTPQAGTSETKIPGEEVSLCEVVKAPSKYSGHRLSIQGIVLGEHKERLILMYPECQFGILLSFSSEVQRQPDVQMLFRAIRRGNPGTTDRDISGRFTGEFSYSEEGSKMILQTDKVDHLKSPKA